MGIHIHGENIYGVALDGRLYRQNLFRMCNISTWEGPLTELLKVRSVAVFGEVVVKLYAVELETGKVFWLVLKDLHPHKEWVEASADSTTAIVASNQDLKEACRDMLESEWREQGAHLDRRAAAARVRTGFHQPPAATGSIAGGAAGAAGAGAGGSIGG